MEIKDEIYNYVQDSLKSNIIPSAHEIVKICNAKYIKKEYVIELIDKKIKEIDIIMDGNNVMRLAKELMTEPLKDLKEEFK